MSVYYCKVSMKHGQYKIMDKKLIRDALAQLAKHGIDGEEVDLPSSLGDRGVDAMVTLGAGRHATKYAVLAKKGLRPASLGAVIHQLDLIKHKSLLITDYVSPQIAETLKAHQVAFLDTVGNAFLEQPTLFVWVKGEKSSRQLDSRGSAGRAFQASGLKVILALLSNPDWIGSTYRDFAPRAGVSRGTVGLIMTELTNLGFAAEIDGRRRLLQLETLLKQWAEAYARTLRPKIVLGRYDTDRNDWRTSLQPGDYDSLLGGEAAVERMTGVLRAQICTLYSKSSNPKFIVDYRLRKAQGGPIEILEKFWNFEGIEKDIVPLPLIYADLLANGDARCLEAAEIIYDRIVDEFV